METTQESHSELGAALALLLNAWKSLTSGRVALLGDFNSSPSTRPGWRQISRLWINFLQKPLDYLASVLFSVLLIGVFVAESTGPVLSSNIIGDTIALVASQQCGSLCYSDGTKAFDYSRQCYNAKSGKDGCTSFLNQSITFKESSKKSCPFAEEICAFKNVSAVIFDTGLVDAKLLGINSATQLQFRRRSACLPLKADGKHLRSITSDPSSQIFKIGKYEETLNFFERLGTIGIKYDFSISTIRTEDSL